MDLEPDSIRRARPLLGTFVEICVPGGNSSPNETAVEAAFDAIAKVHRLMSFHEPESDLSHLNRDAHRCPVEVDTWTFRVLECALDLHHRSSGIFDVSIASSLQKLGFLPGAKDGSPFGQSKEAPGRDIELLSGNRVRFCGPEITIDLGGIAKGFAVDCAIEVLKVHGITNGLVNAGGDIAVFGSGQYVIDLRHPLDPQCLLCQIELRDEAVASSGSSFEPFQSLQLNGSAIIHPTTGKQAEAISGATVRASSCIIADALTKVVMLCGVTAGALLNHYNASALFVSADGSIQCTSDWQGTIPLAA